MYLRQETEVRRHTDSRHFPGETTDSRFTGTPCRRRGLGLVCRDTEQTGDNGGTTGETNPSPSTRDGKHVWVYRIRVKVTPTPVDLYVTFPKEVHVNGFRGHPLQTRRRCYHPPPSPFTGEKVLERVGDHDGESL